MALTHSESPMFEPNSRIGQHLLTDTGILAQTVELVPPASRCVEIGPGPGTITRYLIANENQVTAYEVDERCRPYLDKLSEEGDLTVHWRSILDESNEDINDLGDYNLVGNIPYHISEPLLRKMTGLFFQSAVLFVGERMSRAVTAAHPDDRAWTRMSLVSQAYFDTTIIADVPRTSFDPVPRTDGALILQKRKDEAQGKGDALTQVYRTLVEADNNKSTTAKALKRLVIDPHGNATQTSTRQQNNQRAARRSNKMNLRNYTTEYNAGDSSGLKDREARLTPFDNMLSIVAERIDDTILSKPLNGLSNDELRRLCATVSGIINRRKKRSS